MSWAIATRLLGVSCRGARVRPPPWPRLYFAQVGLRKSIAKLKLVIEGKSYTPDNHTNVTPSILSLLSKEPLYRRPSHPIHTLRTLIESHFGSSFVPVTTLSPIVSTQKNFDDLGFAEDHPGRRLTDSYYINATTMLRTHTSAHEVEIFSQGKDKWLLTADVYRRDEIDASHYPVFHQMEGARTFALSDPDMEARLEKENTRLDKQLADANILIEDDTRISPANPYQISHNPRHAELVTANLKHSLNSLILTLFGGRDANRESPLRVRWIEAFFPFTTPSYEVEVFFQGKWLEILGCGVVQQATLDRASVQDRIGWAFGLGLERIAMVLFSIPDIRLFWSSDPRFLDQFKLAKISTFKPYSKYPASYRDISFWTPEEVELQENDFCDIVRDEAGDLVEDVKLIDEFVHPKSSRKSQCYRINYRSMERSLSNEEVGSINARVIARLQENLDVELR